MEPTGVSERVGEEHNGCAGQTLRSTCAPTFAWSCRTVDCKKRRASPNSAITLIVLCEEALALRIIGQGGNVGAEVELAIECGEKIGRRFPFVRFVPVVDRLAFASALTVGGLFLGIRAVDSRARQGFLNRNKQALRYAGFHRRFFAFAPV